MLKRLGFHTQFPQFQAERAGAMLKEPADGIGGNSWDRMSSRSYGSVYSRTATVMHDLEAQLGSEATAKAFKAYYARWSFRHPSVADLRETLAEVTGQRALVARVFAQKEVGRASCRGRVCKYV